MTWFIRAPIAVIVSVLQSIVGLFIGDAGTGIIVNIEDIIFSGAKLPNNDKITQVNLLDINFFDFSNSDTTIGTLRNGVAKWYYALRNIAMVLSLVVLLYIGIRMAISTIASDKAVYKKMLMDWATSFALLFVLHYIMVIVINLNNSLVGLLYKSMGNARLGGYEKTLMKNMFSMSLTVGLGSIAIEAVLIGVKLMYFVLYVQRLLTIGFLIAIAPLITITYSIDKLGDQKSQALDTWLKEFVFNVLIQPFHCIIYLMFITTTMGMLSTGGGLKVIVLAIIAMLFMHKAEDIVKKIFGFEKASSLMGAAAAGAMVTKALEKGSKAVSAGKSTANKVTAKQGKSGITRKNNAGTTSALPGGQQGAGQNGTGNQGGNQSPNTPTSNTNSQNSGTAQKVRSPIMAAISSTAQSAKDKVGSGINSVKEGAHNLKTNPLNTLGRAAKRAGSGIAQMNIRGLAKTMEILPRVGLGLITAGATGSAIAGYTAGKAYKGSKFTRKISSKLGEEADYWNDRHKEKNEASKYPIQEADAISGISSAYQNYKMANPSMTDEQLSDKSQELLKADVNGIDNKNERAYAESLQKLQNLYSNNTAIKNPERKVLDKVKDVQLGKVKSNVSIKTKAISDAIDKLQEKNPAFSDKDITMMVSKEFMQDIDSARDSGEKYMSSEKYKGLSSEEKDLAKEIYKTKEVLSAIGDNDQKSVNKQIENVIEEKYK